MIINRELVILLQRFKLSLGKSKTSQVTDLISGALREDKQYWIEHDLVIKLTTDKLYELPQNFMKQSIDKQKNRLVKEKAFSKFFRKNFHNRAYKTTLQKHLFIIKAFSDIYPNSGQLISALSEFENRLLDMNSTDFKNTGTEVEVIIAILVDIIKKNPKITEIGVKLLSTLIQKIESSEFQLEYLEGISDFISIDTSEIKFKYIQSVNKKLHQSSYNDYLEIWLQRLIIKNLKDDTEISMDYITKSKNELVRLCNAVLRRKEIKKEFIFNEDWLKEKYRLDLKKLVNEEEILKLPELISSDEIYLVEYDLNT
ncbi:reverse transcriptase [Listeria aquatica]|uniref:reverse transcriptase n=1 Tax=Listeria aquatica TaxID=1494960 RepID=UPI0004BC9297|nr:reverse transcriptase [Listeria aquatica]